MVKQTISGYKGGRIKRDRKVEEKIDKADEKRAARRKYIEEKFGNPLLSYDRIPPRFHWRYEMYLEDLAHRRRTEIFTWVCFAIAFAFLLASFFYVSFLFSALIWLMLGLFGTVNHRIDTIEIFMDEDDLFGALTKHAEREEISKILEEAMEKRK